jgi:hypothetical protein
MAYKDRSFSVEVVMELYRVPASPDPQVIGAKDAAEDVLNLGAWFQKGWNSAASIGEKGADLVAGMFDRLLEADGLGYDSEGDQTEN